MRFPAVCASPLRPAHRPPAAQATRGADSLYAPHAEHCGDVEIYEIGQPPEGVFSLAKILLSSRCAWSLYNFRQGQMRELKRRGDTVIGGAGTGDGFESKIEALDVPFASLPVHKKAIHPAADLKLFWAMYRWYRRERPDIVHHFTIKPVIYGSLAARLAGVPRIVNSIEGLGLVFSGKDISLLRRLVEWQYRIALRSAHHTFFLNRDDQKLFTDRKIVLPRHTELLPGCGVDTDHFAPPDSSPKAINEAGSVSETTERNRPVRFLMVARMLKPKGVYEFAAAAKTVREQLPGTEFVLLGGCDERSPSVVPEADLRAWNAEGRLCWLGEQDDVRGEMLRADVVVLPSFYREGTPRSLLEAASLGRPLITTENVGCRETVEDGVTGLLVPMRDADALAAAMLKLARDPALRRKMGRAGREKMIAQFDEAIVLGKIVAVYDKETL